MTEYNTVVEHRTDHCSSQPCNNGAQCISDAIAGFECYCSEQFYGETCELRGKVIKKNASGDTKILYDSFLFQNQHVVTILFISIGMTFCFSFAPSRRKR